MNEKDYMRELSQSFIRAVKVRLRQLGADQVDLRPEWCSLDENDESFSLKIPVSADFVLPVRARHDFAPTCNDEAFDIAASEFAASLVNISRGKGPLTRYARSVRDEALRVIEKARADGVDIRFVKVDFKPALAQFLGNEDLKDGLDFVLAEVHVSVLQADFRRCTVSCVVEDVEDLQSDLAGFIDEQQENQSRLDDLVTGDASAEETDLGADIIGRWGYGAPASLSSV